MSLNDLIATGGQTIDTLTPVVRRQEKQRQDRLDTQQAQSQQIEDELNMERLKQFRLDSLDARQQSRLKSSIIGAAELNMYLAAGDKDGARRFLEQRKTNLMKRMAAGENIDTAETDDALKRLDADPEGLLKLTTHAMTLGEHIGVLTPKKGAGEGFSLSPGQTRYDANGKVVATAPRQAGMVEVADPLTGEVTLQPARKLSATDTKEIYEASDIIQSSNSARLALTKAKEIMAGAGGAEPYSGFGAGARAAAARVPVVGDLVADKERGAATTEYTNLVTQQALDSLKATFGGMPTEGERRILLQMQALSDYTPLEQTRIIDNALAAIERRQTFNKQKISAVQAGDYTALGEFADTASPTGTQGPAAGAAETETPRQRLERLRAQKAQQR